MLPVCTRKQICCILCPVDQERDFSLFCGAKKRTTPLATKRFCTSLIITFLFKLVYDVCFFWITKLCVLSVIFLYLIWFILYLFIIIHNSFCHLLNCEHTTCWAIPEVRKNDWHHDFLFLTSPEAIKNLPSPKIDGENQYLVFFTSFTDLLSLIFYLGIIHLVHQSVKIEIIEIIDSARTTGVN